MTSPARPNTDTLPPERMADAIVSVLADFVPLCNDSEFQAVDRAREWALALASRLEAAEALVAEQQQVIQDRLSEATTVRDKARRDAERLRGTDRVLAESRAEWADAQVHAYRALTAVSDRTEETAT